ncbi:hypothetical protein NEIRO03_2392, partial [Nematocida sp. AWRm78]
DISNAIQDSNLEEIKQSSEGIIFIRDNNYNSCKYGFHYDILNTLSDNEFEDTHFNSNNNKPTFINIPI